MAVDPRSPCVIGVAQMVSRPDDGPAPEPLVMWERTCRDAAADAQASGDVLAAVESVQIVYCQSWQYDDPAGRLCAQLGIEAKHQYYSGIGGTTPQVLVDNAAEAIVDGDLDVAIVCGAEALDTVRRLKKTGEKPQWSHKDPERKPFPFEAPFHPAEVAHEVFQAYTTFALWDVARRAHLGVAPDDYRRQIGELFAPMTTIAAANPYAWFPVERSADDIVTATPENRMVAYPYTKYSISVMDVDLAGAIVIASHEAADRLGVPADRRCTCTAGATPPIRSTSPSTTPRGRLPRWRPRRPKRCESRSAASTTSPTSISTAASRRRCSSRSTRWASNVTTRGG